ncbi:MAG TPA: hypothetical protein VNN10_01280 [Dehalococcoidia bacterium]|nr:hypothetical protein [Dehalococcoidia bacterium]
MTLLFRQIGEPDSMRGEGASATFNIKNDLGGGVCAAEGSLEYTLPDGTRCSHKSDILLSCPRGKHVAIEIKFLSAVTDQFKTRSYDMLQLKKAHGENLVGIMVYLHAAGIGIGIERARSICYPYDHFFGFDFDSGALEANRWTEVVNAVEEAVAQW